MAEPQDINALLDEAIETWNKKNPGRKVGIPTEQIVRLSQESPELLTPAMQKTLANAEDAWADANRQENFATKVTDFLNSPAGIAIVAGSAFIPGGGLIGGGARLGSAALKGVGLRALFGAAARGGAAGAAKVGAAGGIAKAIGGAARGAAARTGAAGGIARAAGGAARKAAPTIAKRGIVGAGIGAGAEAAREVFAGEFPQPRALGAAAGVGAIGGQIPGGPLARTLAAGVGGPFAGSVTSQLGQASDETGPGASPPPGGESPEAQTIANLIAAGDEAAITAQYQQWLVDNPTAAQQLLAQWAQARRTPPTGGAPAGGVLEVPRPGAITLKDEQGNPVLGPDGQPIQLVFSEQTGQYTALPVKVVETDEGGNKVERTIDPLTGKEDRRLLTRQPIRQMVGGREVFVDPETGSVISATDRLPVEQTIGGRRQLIDPDTGEVVERFKTEQEEAQELESQRIQRFQTAMPLLTQLASQFSQPSSRLRFLAQEGQRAGATDLPEFSLIDVLSSILGGGEAPARGGATGAPATEGGFMAPGFGGALGAGGTQARGGGFQVSPRLAEILGLPAGSPLPIGGLKISQLPPPQALSGLTTEERSELDAIIDISTGGTRLTDLERKQRELTPPGGFGATARFTR